MEQIAAYKAYWRNAPPVDALVAAYMGFKPPGQASPENNDAAIEQMAKFFGGLPQ